MNTAPLVIEFVTPSSLWREADRHSALPIVGNGPPGTFVRFADGWRVSLPTDQIVSASDDEGCVRVGFGGMEYVGVENGQLAFVRVRELRPEHELSPARSHKMLLEPRRVAALYVAGARVPLDLPL